MIVPVTDEEAWQGWLTSAPFWDGPLTSAVVVVPHPDDEVLGVGGLIASIRRKNLNVLVVAVTDGEKAYPEVNSLAAVRAKEQNAALACLQVPREKVIRLQLPDSNVASFQSTLTDTLLPLASRQTLLIAPWSHDYHPDHEACGRAAAEVAKATGAPLVSYLFWAWHFKTPEVFKGTSLRRFSLTRDLLDIKAKALSCHQSQLAWPGEAPILYEPLLAPSRRAFETFVIQ